MVRAIVLISGKADNFIAGADIEEFTRLRTAEEATALSRQAQDADESRRVALRKPVVAAIHGSLPWRRTRARARVSLAHRHRSSQDPAGPSRGAARLIPGAGGCNRLPRLIGVRAALDIILAGQDRARGQGDASSASSTNWCIRRSCASIALRAAARLAQDGASGRARTAGRGGLAARWHPAGSCAGVSHGAEAGAEEDRRALPGAARGTGHRARQHVERHGGGARVRGRFASANSPSPTCRATWSRIFFATTALKKDDGVPPGTVGRFRRWRASAWSVRDSWARVSPGRPRSTPKSRCACATPTLPGSARGLDAPPASSTTASSRKRLTRPEHQRLAALVSGSADDERFRASRPGHRGGVRGPRREARRGRRSLEQVRAARRGDREQHIDHSHRRYRRRRGPSRAHPRHALLLAGREDAAARGDPARGHRRRVPSRRRSRFGRRWARP